MKKRKPKTLFMLAAVWFFTWLSLWSTAKLKCLSHSTLSRLRASFDEVVSQLKLKN